MTRPIMGSASVVTHRHSERTKDNCQTGEPVGSCMVSIGDQRRAVNLASDANTKNRLRVRLAAEPTCTRT